MRFGPDAFYVDRPADPWAAPDYTVYEYHLDDAHKAITKYPLTFTHARFVYDSYTNG
jgi:hypothetical protein